MMKHLRLLLFIPLLFCLGSVQHHHSMVLARKNAGGGGYPAVDYDHYVDLNGSSDYITTPESTAHDLSGDYDMVWLVSFDDAVSAGDNQTLAAKWESVATKKSWLAFLGNSTNKLLCYLSSDGDSTLDYSQTDNIGLSDATKYWIRHTYDAAPTPTSAWYVVADTGQDGPGNVTWGSSETISHEQTVTSIYDSSQALLLGKNASDDDYLEGKMYYFHLAKTISGTITVIFNASQTLDSGATFNNVDGETDWTKSGGTWGTD